MNERWIKLLGVSSSFLVTLVSGWMFDTDDQNVIIVRMVTVLGGSILQWETAHFFIRIARKRFPGVALVKKRVLFTAAAFIAISVAFSLTGDFFLDHIIDHQPFILQWQRMTTIFINSIYFAVTTVGLFEAVYYYSNYNRAEMEKQELVRTNLQTRFDSLKGQVNPHFLFNSLNSLSSLITIDPPKAEQFVVELSSVYRYLLKSNEKHLNTLQEEIDFIRSFVYLLTSRFGSNLTVSIDAATEFSAYFLPPLTLQLLVENAVKHNVISAEAPLHIRIFTTADARLHVVNNLQKKHREVFSEKVGLANIINKYRLLHQPELIATETGSEFHVAVPLIKEDQYERIYH
jgi:two-component system, LytTR family, sensor kinase